MKTDLFKSTPKSCCPWQQWILTSLLIFTDKLTAWLPLFSSAHFSRLLSSRGGSEGSEGSEGWGAAGPGWGGGSPVNTPTHTHTHTQLSVQDQSGPWQTVLVRYRLLSAKVMPARSPCPCSCLTQQLTIQQKGGNEVNSHPNERHNVVFIKFGPSPPLVPEKKLDCPVVFLGHVCR